MSNSKPLRDVMAPIAKGFMSMFCERVGQSSDTQRTVTWTLTRWDDYNVPLEYECELQIRLKHTGNGVETPKRRAGDA